MNKRQIKKRYKRINGNNPPKYFTVAQMKKCTTNSTFNNACAIMFYNLENWAKKASCAISGVVKHFNNLQVAKMVGIDLEKEAEGEEDVTDIYDGNIDPKEGILLGDLGIRPGESRTEWRKRLLNE